MSPAQLELNQPNPKSLETFSMDSSSAKESNQRTPYFSAGPDPGFRTTYKIAGRELRIQSRSERMNLPVLQRAERHACAEQLGEDVAYHNPRLELAHHPEAHGDDRLICAHSLFRDNAWVSCSCSDPRGRLLCQLVFVFMVACQTCVLGVSDSVKNVVALGRREEFNLLSAAGKLTASTPRHNKPNQPELLITESLAWSPLVPFLIAAAARFLKLAR